jgi:hypothetical protein
MLFCAVDSHQGILYIILKRSILMLDRNLGCLHPVAHVISDDVVFNPSTQRHYHSTGVFASSCACDIR